MWIAGAETKNAVFSGQKNAPSLTNRHSPDGALSQRGAHLASTTVEAGFQPASDGRILASSPIATGGRDAALLASWKPASTVLVVPARCAGQRVARVSGFHWRWFCDRLAP
jgi:hypothetical protein